MLKLKTGEFNQRITLQRPVKTTDELGQRVGAWQDVATVWAKAKPVRGREYVAADAQQHDGSVVFTIRWRADPAGTWRALWRGVPYALTADPIDPLGAKQALELVCASGPKAA